MQKLPAGSKTALVFEEDAELLGMLSELLRGAGIDSFLARNANEAIGLFEGRTPDLLVLNSKVSEISFLELLRRLRRGQGSQVAHTAILILADSTEAAFFSVWKEFGGIEILLRPFDRSRFVSKVLSMFDSDTHASGLPKNFFGLRIDAASEDVHLEGERIHLTRSEFKLLQEFVRHPGRVLDRDHLIRKVQGEGVAVIDRAIDTHVFSLRKKLGQLGSAIETVRGEGYRFRNLMNERLK